MHETDSAMAKHIAQAAMAFEQQATGRLPGAVTVVLSDDTVVATLRGTFSPAETALAQSAEGAAHLRELHRQLFTTASDPLRQQISKITGVKVREATAEVETSTGTVVQVFTLAQAVPAGTWSGSGSDSLPQEKDLERRGDDDDGMNRCRPEGL